jgi:nucleoside-diphosphate-sugar epimerase
MTSSQSAVGPGAPGETPDESAVCRPLTYYGKSKLAAERLLALYPAVPSVILRPVSVYGPRDRDVLTLLKSIRRGLAPVIGSLDRRLTFVYVTDLVQALLLAAEAPQAVGQTYFVTDGQVYTWREFKAASEKVLGRHALSLPIPPAVVYALAALSDAWSRLTGKTTIFNLNKAKEIVEQNWGCSSEKLQRDLGYHPQYPLERGLQDTLAWAQTAGWI